MAAHAQIVRDAESDLRKRGMGTTFVGCVIAGGRLVPILGAVCCSPTTSSA